MTSFKGQLKQARKRIVCTEIKLKSLIFILFYASIAIKKVFLINLKKQNMVFRTPKTYSKTNFDSTVSLMVSFITQFLFQEK